MAEFVCPKCGARAGVFCIDEGPNMECPDLHVDDEVHCYGEKSSGEKCRHTMTGQGLATSVVKKKNLVQCPCCKGAGYVDKSKAK
jgi:hypothetical protein